ncbi:MAG TPA: diaminopimelate epimerase [Nocardioidaceae bacterium]|nr:diaminopimelate epimerase [Nocardioidaceae bacterium]
MNFPFVKGHGTENDFVVLPDLNGSVHGDLSAEVVRRLCNRRTGIGADGVLRVMRSKGAAPWFMDYRNADGSAGEVCGNGIRVFARYLQRTRLADTTRPLLVDTRSGVKTVTFCDDDEVSVGMGVPRPGGPVKVSVEGRNYDARAVDLGNPHAVTFVDTLAEVGSLREPPSYSAVDFPSGANLEFVVPREPGHLMMRVFERGVGETKSCGTGACAAVVATAYDEPRPVTYTVDVPGGTLTVTWDEDGEIHLKGPAVLVAEGIWVD